LAALLPLAAAPALASTITFVPPRPANRIHFKGLHASIAEKHSCFFFPNLKANLFTISKFCMIFVALIPVMNYYP
jgi:hypothetical protein